MLAATMDWASITDKITPSSPLEVLFSKSWNTSMFNSYSARNFRTSMSGDGPGGKFSSPGKNLSEVSILYSMTMEEALPSFMVNITILTTLQNLISAVRNNFLKCHDYRTLSYPWGNLHVLFLLFASSIRVC